MHLPQLAYTDTAGRLGEILICHAGAVPTDADAPQAKLALTGGVNFTTWPDLKWSRASSYVTALQSRLQEWHASAPVSVDSVLTEDRHGIDLIARAPRGIPKHEWALDVGDALHNMRSAFDAVAWGMAHFNDATPTRPKRVQFPICEDEKSWDEAVKAWVGELDPELQHRLRVLQPFTYATEGQVTTLVMLHDLDIQDKHRETLTVNANVQAVNVNASYEYEEGHPMALPRIEMVTDIKFADGVRLGTIHAGAPIRMLGQMILRPAMQVQLTYRDQTFDVLPMLHQLLAETRRCLDILMHGLAPLDDGEDPGWQNLGTNVGPT